MRKRKQYSRKTDKPSTVGGWFLKNSKDIIAVIVLAGMVSAGMSHFATAGDVEKKFTSIKIELKVVSLEARKARIEDELFRLRADPKRPNAIAQIQRYESELRDLNARLRDLEQQR